MLTVLDEYTREALCVAVAPKMGSADVLEALHPLLLERGKPEYLRSDNGSEFIAETLQTWLQRISIKPIQIYPGSPWENGNNERFNGTLHREVLNAEWFTSIDQARVVINQWLRQYNHVRPLEAFSMHAPVPETIQRKAYHLALKKGALQSLAYTSKSTPPKLHLMRDANRPLSSTTFL